jgi:23S rRNA (pseudouridine1915-N3)-methyltransferase
VRIVVAAVGRVKDGPERDLCQRYLTRLAGVGPAVGLSVSVREVAESRAASAAERRRQEAVALRAQASGVDRLIALDERGALRNSVAFAEDLVRARDMDAATAFLIGGADGLDPELRDAASATLCFGSMTWPHQLVRAMLLEQIYRAATILAGHPYHRA